MLTKYKVVNQSNFTAISFMNQQQLTSSKRGFSFTATVVAMSLN
jgi:hypothetical protein